MEWLWYLILTVALLAGLAVNVFGLPGLWLMVGFTILYGWITGWSYVGLWTIATLVAIGIVAEIVEFIAAGAGAKKAGGSRRAAWGALVGGMVGAIFLSVPIFGIGTIIGACLGAAIGALAMEYTVHGRTGQSLRVGAGAAWGKLLGLASKLTFGILMLLVAMVAALPLPWRRAPLTVFPGSQPATLPATQPVVER